MAFDFTPVVIIGAGRSGTNMLRDMLSTLPGFATWPCDEINPIWRHGNTGWPDDEIPPGRATPAVRAYIRRAFTRLWRATGRPDFVVEKTCANSLRVPFVQAVLPEAKFLYIVRDGADVAASAARRWQGDLEMPGLPYFLAKARYAPVADLPRYAWRALRGRAGILLGAETRLASWGPRFAGIDGLAGAPLDEICARQWAACVEASDRAFAAMAPEDHLAIGYEALTARPGDGLARILAFLGAGVAAGDIARAGATVRPGSVGKGRRGAVPARLAGLMQPALARHGYDG